MADLEAIEVLTQAKERLFECGWGTGAHFSREDRGEGRETLCLEESLSGIQGEYVSTCGNPAVKRAAQYVRTLTPIPVGAIDSLYSWNDLVAKSAGDVVAVLDEAILIAKEAPNPHG